ncbi:MAG: ABC transporter ATP-binding protein [Anaerolineae bacterium]
MNEIAIRVEGLGKRYRIGGPQERYKTLRDTITDVAVAPVRRLRRLGQPAPPEEIIWALKDVSFEVKHGEVLGIIGRNGAGKTTLLKVLSRITEPTEGYAELHGRVGSLLEVGTGFHPELTGRENIYLNGAILGMKRAEIDARFDEIVAFAEIEKFLDTPVKRYSSGMHVRLAFAVAAHLEPEILLVDEVLAVGDVAFQKKCLGKMGDVAKEGRTVLFVSHNMAAVENLCQRGLLVDQGRVSYIGSQTGAIAQYLKSLSGSVLSLREREDRQGSGELRVVGIEIRDIDGNVLDTVASGQDVDVYLHFETAAGFDRSRVIASLMLKTQISVPVFLHHNRLTQNEFGELPRSGAFVCRLQGLPLPPSTYRVGYSIIADAQYLDRISDATGLTVVEGDFFGSGEVPPITHGVCLVKGSWRLVFNSSVSNG